MIKTIADNGELNTHFKALIAIEPHFARTYHAGDEALQLRAQSGGFLRLYQTIVSQQLSVSAASRIWQNLTQAELMDEACVLAADVEDFRRQGLSRQKIRYVKSLAAERIDYYNLTVLSDEHVVDILTQVVGIGRWSAEVYCLFALRRADIIAANDLALQVATQHLLALDSRPKESEMRALALAWSPYRSAASYLLWHYYSMIKQRQGINI